MFKGLWIKSVNYKFSVVEDDQRHDISVKVVVPFTIPAVVLLNIS